MNFLNDIKKINPQISVAIENKIMLPKPFGRVIVNLDREIFERLDEGVKILGEIRDSVKTLDEIRDNVKMLEEIRDNVRTLDEIRDNVKALGEIRDSVKTLDEVAADVKLLSNISDMQQEALFVLKDIKKVLERKS